MRGFRKVIPACLAFSLVFSDGALMAETQADYPLSSTFEGAVSTFDLTQFSSETLDGESFSEENLKDADITMINFWATWCPPCVAEMPDLAAFQKSVPSNVQVITFCIDGDETSIRSILADSGYEGITLRTVDGDLVKIASRIMYIPTTLFYDSEGRSLGAGVIGGQADFAKTYTDEINSLLMAMGKDEMDFSAGSETEAETESGAIS